MAINEANNKAMEMEAAANIIFKDKNELDVQAAAL